MSRTDNCSQTPGSEVGYLGDCVRKPPLPHTVPQILYPVRGMENARSNPSELTWSVRRWTPAPATSDSSNASDSECRFCPYFVPIAVAEHRLEESDQLRNIVSRIANL